MSQTTTTPPDGIAASYDPGNIFARLLRGEIPSQTVAESAHALAFRDVRPQAPVHVLVIPRGPYLDAADFGARASDAEIVDFTRLLAQVAATLGLDPASGGPGFRIISNAGADGAQEVPHYHVHLVGGAGLGRMLAAR